MHVSVGMAWRVDRWRIEWIERGSSRRRRGRRCGRRCMRTRTRIPNRRRRRSGCRSHGRSLRGTTTTVRSRGGRMVMLQHRKLLTRNLPWRFLRWITAEPMRVVASVGGVCVGVGVGLAVIRPYSSHILQPRCRILTLATDRRPTLLSICICMRQMHRTRARAIATGTHRTSSHDRRYRPVGRRPIWARILSVGLRWLPSCARRRQRWVTRYGRWGDRIER